MNTNRSKLKIPGRKRSGLFIVAVLEVLRYNKLMDEISRYAVGLDVGTDNVRTVVASVAGSGALNVIGYAEVPNSGMRRGVVSDLTGAGTARAIDRALGEAERMSGHEVNNATISINGAQIVSTRTEGMIAVGAADHEISEADLARVETVALQGRVPANQAILKVVPLQFILDGQGEIKNPLGMTGSRLEMKANVISTLSPSYDNLCKTAEQAKVAVERVMPSVEAAARAVLTERQRENGVAVVDIGATTTGVAVYEGGDLQYIGVVPVGSNFITNDLATVLVIDVELAEEIKRRFATGSFGAADTPVVIRWKGKELRFERGQIDEVVQARVEEILEMVRKELRKARYDQRLPEGIVLTGGGARMRDIDKFVRDILEMSARVGVPTGLSGMTDVLGKPEYAAAVGLMLASAEGGAVSQGKKMKNKAKKAKKPGIIGRFLSKF